MIKALFKKNKILYLCTIILFIISAIGSGMIYLRKYVIGDAWYSFLIWNVLLSWIPYLISFIIIHLYEIKRIRLRRFLVIIALFFWLLFYPNAPYMITDYIHIESYNNVLMWYDFVVFSLFIYSSFIMGFISLYVVFSIMSKRYSVLVKWLIVIYILFITSYGIYLGRVFRLNSWDLLFKPFLLIKNVVINFNQDAIIFSLVFGLLLVLVYGVLYFMTFLGKNINDNIKNKIK